MFRGHFASAILECATPRKLYLIDPWTKAGEFFGWGGEHFNDDTLTTRDARREVELRASLHPRTDVRIIEGYFGSDELAIEEPLDWAYLDASHQYGSTLWELRRLADVVKPGGMIAGDDWHADPAHEHHGVFQAVQTFIKTSDFQFLAGGPGNQYVLRRNSSGFPRG